MASFAFPPELVIASPETAFNALYVLFLPFIFCGWVRIINGASYLVLNDMLVLSDDIRSHGGVFQ